MSALRPLLGVLHLGPLPSARGHGSMQAVCDGALADAAAYAEAGFDGLVVDAQTSAHASRYVNHADAEACNVEAQHGVDARRGQLVIRFVARRPISVGDELTICYGGDFWRDRPWVTCVR